jgi:hypothetical protein
MCRRDSTWRGVLTNSTWFKGDRWLKCESHRARITADADPLACCELGRKEPNAVYPRVLKRVGEAPAQYPGLEEDEEG